MANKYTIVIVINLINVLLSIFKDVALASYLGTSKAADLFFIAFFIPDMIGSNLMAVAFGVASVSLLANTYEKEGLLQVQKVYEKILGISLKVSAGVTLLILLSSGILMALLGRGFDPEHQRWAFLMLVLMSPAVLAYPLVTIRMSLLQVLSRYGRASLGSVLMNLVILMGVIGLNISQMDRFYGVFGVSLLVLMALLFEIFYLELAVKKSMGLGFTLWNKPLKIKKGELTFVEKDFYSKFSPYLILLLLTQIMVYYERYLGSGLEQGSIAALGYANRLSQFPIFVFGYSIALVALPELSKLISGRSFVQAGALYQMALRRLFMFSIPLALGLSFLSEPLVTILFKHNAFDSGSVRLCVAVLSGYGLAVIGQCIILLNIRILTALGEMKFSIMLVIGVLIGNIALYKLLVSRIGIAGIGYGAFAGATVMALLLTGIILKRLGLSAKEEALFALKVILLNGVTILVTIGLKTLWNGYFELQGTPCQIGYGFVAGLTICGVSFLSMRRAKFI